MDIELLVRTLPQSVCKLLLRDVQIYCSVGVILDKPSGNWQAPSQGMDFRKGFTNVCIKARTLSWFSLEFSGSISAVGFCIGGNSLSKISLEKSMITWIKIWVTYCASGNSSCVVE